MKGRISMVSPGAQPCCHGIGRCYWRRKNRSRQAGKLGINKVSSAFILSLLTTDNKHTFTPDTPRESKFCLHQCDQMWGSPISSMFGCYALNRSRLDSSVYSAWRDWLGGVTPDRCKDWVISLQTRFIPNSIQMSPLEGSMTVKIKLTLYHCGDGGMDFKKWCQCYEPTRNHDYMEKNFHSECCSRAFYGLCDQVWLCFDDTMAPFPWDCPWIITMKNNRLAFKLGDGEV